MIIRHKVKQGECLHSIAMTYGVRWKDIWYAPENNKLHSKRVPEILYPGDEVTISKEPKEEDGATNQKNRFRRTLGTVRLHLRLLDEGEPRAGESYVLEVDDQRIEGQTDGMGCLEAQIPAEVTRVVLRLGQVDDEERYMLEIGALDPIEKITGIQARLHSLGYDTGEIDGIVGQKTRSAIAEFQKEHDLPVTGKIDVSTQDTLKEAYGS